MDLISLAAAKNYTNKVAAGFKNIELDGMNLIFTLLDDTKATIAIPAPADGKDGVSVKDLSIDTDGSLLCHMTDGTVIDAGYVPTVDPDLTNYYTKEENLNLLPRLLGVQMGGYIKTGEAYTFNTTDIARIQQAFDNKSAMGCDVRVPMVLYFGSGSSYYLARGFAICSYSNTGNASDGTTHYDYQCLVFRPHTDSDIWGVEDREMTIIVKNSTKKVTKGTITKARPLRALTPDASAASNSITTKGYVDAAIANIDIPEVDLTSYYTKEETDNQNVNSLDFYTVKGVNSLPSSGGANTLGSATSTIIANIRESAKRKRLAAFYDTTNCILWYPQYILDSLAKSATGLKLNYVGSGTGIAGLSGNSGSTQRSMGSTYLYVYVNIDEEGNITKSPDSYSPNIGMNSSQSYLSIWNTKAYTPTGDYHPATKKYVDDKIGEIEAVLATLTTPSSEGGN